MDMIPAQTSEGQAAILEGWAVAAAEHAERIRAKNVDIAAHLNNQAAFTGQMATNSPFVNTTADIAEVITGCFADSLND